MNEIKIFISMPMRGKSEKQIESDYELANKAALHVFETEVFEGTPAEYYVSTVHGCTGETNPVKGLAKSIEILSECDYAYFYKNEVTCEGYGNSRGCNIEREICEKYGIKILGEEKGLDEIKKSREEIEHEIADHYGAENQLIQLQEECGELWGAVHEYVKDGYSPCFIAEEMADVSIMIDQVAYLTKLRGAVDEQVAHKLKRQLERIKNGTENKRHGCAQGNIFYPHN